MMVCAMIEIFRKCIFKIVGTGKSIDFYIFVKVGYYPLLALACVCILIHTVTVYCIWSYIVIVIWIIWLNLDLI